MIKKILIANRGEIAERIIRACKELNIETVAIYSEADAGLNYVQQADEAYPLGPAPVNESYLNVDKIIDIAKETKADALHPGYGFLSENADFVDRCEKKGLIFIGPSSEVMRKMGDKVTARKVMDRIGLPIIPGSKGEVESVEEAISIANRLGYPIMVKASAGGGGIGMEIVNDEEELVKSFTNNSKRAEMFFGSGRMYLEKVIENARHIEIQILADHYGNVVHLFERECSIQRRNQKVLEETPSIFLSDETRQKMGEVAVLAAKTLNYKNAGTIEFLVDEEENFYFLEMNTRVQVEHPITEQVTNIDIVKKQIKIAKGEKLNLNQESITITGHSIEVRIYAEDPKTFFPSPGTITSFEIPTGNNIRHELTYQAGDRVTHFYDPMIGKLIVTGKSREEAINLLRESLDEYKIEGIKSNIPLLQHIVTNEQFIQGHTLTNYIENQYISKI